MYIRDLTPADDVLIAQVAEILVEAFREHWPNAWPTLDAALDEVRESFAPGRASRVALDDDGMVLGWIGGISGYGGNVWELHPLAVRPARQRQGIGRALVADLEERARERGALTVTLGTDDEDDMTTLAAVDLYDGLWAHIARVRNIRGHPYEFYQKLGYAIVGVMPDANGWGRPDILMAKRVGRREEGGPW
jgi:aminoglycoside 6'-N-acetyltransferase I